MRNDETPRNETKLVVSVVVLFLTLLICFSVVGSMLVEVNGIVKPRGIQSS